MKSKSLLLACLLSIGVCLFACKPNDSKVQAAVNEKLSTSPGVTADVKGGVVTLGGEVADEAAKAAAEESVKGVTGVKSVSNNIMVQAPPPPPAAPTVEINPDDVLKKTLDSAYAAGGFTDVKVSVVNGEVTLDGSAKKADVRKIMQTAQQSKPKKVNNKLTLK